MKQIAFIYSFSSAVLSLNIYFTYFKIYAQIMFYILKILLTDFRNHYEWFLNYKHCFSKIIPRHTSTLKPLLPLSPACPLGLPAAAGMGRCPQRTSLCLPMDCSSLWTIICQAPLVQGIFQGKYWIRLLFLPPGDFLTQRLNPMSPTPGVSFPPLRHLEIQLLQ